MIKRTFIFCILSLLCLKFCLSQNHIIVTPAGKMQRAVSGHFAGISDGELMTWGGCNFPDMPCADGGQKVFYPKAYGASVTVPEGTVYIGGTDGKSSSDEVALQMKSEELRVKNFDSSSADGTLLTLHTSLPKGLDNFAACYGVDKIFVAGKWRAQQRCLCFGLA